MGEKEYINYGGYEITIEKLKPSGMYKLTTWAYSMGEEYLESMRTDEVNDEVIEKFINKIERNK